MDGLWVAELSVRMMSGNKKGQRQDGYRVDLSGASFAGSLLSCAATSPRMWRQMSVVALFICTL